MEIGVFAYFCNHNTHLHVHGYTIRKSCNDNEPNVAEDVTKLEILSSLAKGVKALYDAVYNTFSIEEDLQREVIWNLCNSFVNGSIKNFDKKSQVQGSGEVDFDKHINDRAFWQQFGSALES